VHSFLYNETVRKTMKLVIAAIGLNKSDLNFQSLCVGFTLNLR
jgi:hypothetical protein